MSTESWFFIITGLVIFNYLFSNILDYINHKNWKDDIPNELKDFYEKEKYKKAKDYSISKNKIGFLSSTISFLLVFSLLVFNGYGMINDLVSSFESSYIKSGLFFLTLFLINTLISLPFSYYKTFVIEEKFGFNKTTKTTFFLDIIKSSVLSILIGGALLFLALYLYDKINQGFWLWLWIGLSILMIFINMFYADLIVPIFNKLTPLEDGELRNKIEHYSKKVGYLLKNIYVIDGSKRSTKANAFLGGSDISFHLGLIGFSIVFSPISMLSGILMNYISRKNEFEADAYAKQTFNGEDLALALKKLSVDSLSNIYPHPLYVFFHYSHPPLIKRLRALS